MVLFTALEGSDARQSTQVDDSVPSIEPCDRRSGSGS